MSDPKTRQAAYQLPLMLSEYTAWSSGQAAEQETEPRTVRERLHQYGAGELTDAELLGLILCTSAGKEALLTRIEVLLKEFGNLSWLMRADYAALTHEHGLSEAKAAQLLCVLELARRLTLVPPLERYQITSPADAAKLVMGDMAFLDHEEIRVLVLDTKNVVLVNRRLYKGTLNSTSLRTAEVFRLAITRNGAGVIFIHNHPSGNCTPSPEDETVTRQLIEAGKLLDIELVDHLIIGNQSYVSLKERMRW